MNIYIIEDHVQHQTFLYQTITSSLHALRVTLEVHLIKDLYTYKDMLSEITILNSDIYFIDIDLQNSIDGIQIAQLIREKNKKCIIIFVTSDSERSLEVLQKNIYPFDYILKDARSINYTAEQIKAVLQKIIFTLINPKRHLMIAYENSKLYIHFGDILYIETLKAPRRHVHIQTKQKDYIINSPLAIIKKQEFPAYYITELKSYIFNLEEIFSINRKLGVVVFSNNDEIYVSSKIIDKINKKIAININGKWAC